MTLDEARKQTMVNVEAQALYMKTIDVAESKLNKNFKEIPYVLATQLGMINHYRKKTSRLCEDR